MQKNDFNFYNRSLSDLKKEEAFDCRCLEMKYTVAEGQFCLSLTLITVRTKGKLTIQKLDHKVM